MNTEKMYTLSAPVGNAIAPQGPVTEQGLRDFGAQISADDTWKAKFAGDPISDVLEYFRTAGYVITEV